MSKIKETEKPNFLVSLATFIVDKRKAFYLIYIALAVFSLFSCSRTLLAGRPAVL